MGINRIGVTQALFTRTQARVLSLLFSRPDRSFFLNEILKLAGGGSGAVRRELDRLVSAGLATRERIGNQVHYQADNTSMVFKELRALIVKTAGVADVLRNALTAREGEIVSAFIFGSVAAGKDHAGSDIDLVLISDSLSYSDTLVLLESCESFLGRPVNPVLYTPRQFMRKQRDSAFIRRVMEQPRVHLIGKEADREGTGES